MPTFETFSKRQKRLKDAGKPVIYRDEPIPPEFRRQVIHIWIDAIGPYFDTRYSTPLSNQVWDAIHGLLTRELGVFHLGDSHLNAFEKCQQYILTADTGGVLDIIDLSFKAINTEIRQHDLDLQAQLESRIKVSANEAITELNHRLREHALSYQFVDGELIKADSEYLHAEVVEPALTLLHALGFRGPESEFLKAHEHYRHRRYKEAIVDANKAFESVMKVICDQRKVSYDKEHATASTLVNLMFEHGVIPKYLQDQFHGLKNVLASGLPTVRNKTSGHGQGATPVDVPEYLAAYALHAAASNMLLLMEAHVAASPARPAQDGD